MLAKLTSLARYQQLVCTSGDKLPPICLEYEFITYCTFKYITWLYVLGYFPSGDWKCSFFSEIVLMPILDQLWLKVFSQLTNNEIVIYQVFINLYNCLINGL